MDSRCRLMVSAVYCGDHDLELDPPTGSSKLRVDVVRVGMPSRIPGRFESVSSLSVTNVYSMDIGSFLREIDKHSVLKGTVLDGRELWLNAVDDPTSVRLGSEELRLLVKLSLSLLVCG